MNNVPTSNDEEKPPVFKTWKVLYLLVLIFHTLLIGLFSWLTMMFA